MGPAVLAAEDCGDETGLFPRPEGVWKYKPLHTFADSRLSAWPSGALEEQLF